MIFSNLLASSNIVFKGGGANSNGQPQLIQTDSGAIVRQVVVGGGGATPSSGAGQPQLIQTSGGALRQVRVVLSQCMFLIEFVIYPHSTGYGFFSGEFGQKF